MNLDTPPPRVAYISSLSHSGSTLLSLLIGAHSRAVAVGSLLSLTQAPAISCSCGAVDLEQCPFWSAVSRTLADDFGVSISDVGAPADARSGNASWGLYRAVAHVAGATVVVESSKAPRRLSQLLRMQALTVAPLHLVRHPYGVVFSQLRKGRSLPARSLWYAARLIRTRALLHGERHHVVSYETLATTTRATLSGVMTYLDLKLEAQQLRWAECERHVIGGNRMRSATSSSIVLDRSGEQLNMLQRACIDGLTWPARVGLSRR